MIKAGLILRRLAAREMKRNRLQFLSMIIITMLAVTLFCGFVSNTRTLEKAVNEYYKETNLCDLCVQMGTIGEEEKAYFSALDAEVGYRVYAEGALDGKSAKLYVGDTSISRPKVVKGEAGVTLEQRTAELSGIDIGSPVTVSITVPVGGLSFNIDLKAEVTGYMNFPETTVSSSSIAVYISEKTFSEIIKEELSLEVSAVDFYNQVMIKSEAPETLKSEIEEHFSGNENLIFIYDRNSLEAPVLLDGEISQSRKMLYVFPVIFLLVSVFVILTTVNRLILEERTEIGTLKGLGFGKGEILRHYASFGGLLCLIGGAVGALIGPFIVPNVMKVKYQLVYNLPIPFMPVFDIPMTILAVGSVALLATIISILVCKNVVRENPAACMRPMVPKDNIFLHLSKKRDTRTKTECGKNNNLSSGKKENRENSSPKKKGRNDGILSLKMAAGNIAIKPIRAAMTVIGITGCVALLMCALGIGDTIDHSLQTEFYGQFTYDIATPYISEDFSEKMDELKEACEIETYETYKVYYMNASGANKGKDIKVYNFSENMTMTTIDTNNGNVVMSKSVADSLELKEGDSFTLKSGTNTFEFTLNEIVNTAITKGVFLHTDQFGDDIYGTSSAWIKADNVTEALLDKIDDASGTAQASGVQELWDNVEEKASSIDAMKYTLMVFAVLLSVVVLYNLSLLNINERTRDIATLKVLGFTRGRISLILLFEIMLLTLGGTVFGLLLGYPLTYLVLSINTVEVMSFLYYVSPLSYVISAVVALLTSLVINLFFVGSSDKINMIEALKSVE